MPWWISEEHRSAKINNSKVIDYFLFFHEVGYCGWLENPYSTVVPILSYCLYGFGLIDLTPIGITFKPTKIVIPLTPSLGCQFFFVDKEEEQDKNHFTDASVVWFKWSGAWEIPVSKLDLTFPKAVLIERRVIKKLLEKISGKDKKEGILRFFSVSR